MLRRVRVNGNWKALGGGGFEGWILRIDLAHTDGVRESDLDVFARSSVDIIGTERMDEEMLQQLKAEALGVVPRSEEE